MQFTLNQGFSTPRQHPVLSPKQEISNNYNQLMIQYSELEQEMYSQKADNQMKYQQILQKIDSIYYELTNNINQLTTNSKSEYSQLLQELKAQREHNIQMIQNIASKQLGSPPSTKQVTSPSNQIINDDYLDYIEYQEQQILDELQTLESYKHQRIDKGYTSPGSNRRQYSILNSIQQGKVHTPLISTQYSSNTQQIRQFYGNIQNENNQYRVIRESYGSLNEYPKSNNILQVQNYSPMNIQDEEYRQRAYSPINVGGQPPATEIPNQPTVSYLSGDQQTNQRKEPQRHKPIFEQKQSISQIQLNESQILWTQQANERPLSTYNQNHINEQEQFKKELEQLRKQESQKEQKSFISEVKQSPTPNSQQKQIPRHQKEKIFDLSQINQSKDKSLIHPPQQQEILNVSHQQMIDYPNNIQHSNMVPINDQILPIQGSDKILNESQQSVIMDLHGNLGYDQFYQYLRQRYPIILDKINRPTHGDQRLLRQDQEALDLMQYVYCTMCDQFISIKQANNHTAFCLTHNQKTKYKYDDTYLDLFICCTDPKNQLIETKEQKRIRLCNELSKLRYLIEIALKQKEYTHEQQKQKEYCLFALEILTQIIQNPKNGQLNQQAQDLVSIYQVLDQQQYNFYKQIVFLLQKANQRIQQLIQ